VEIVASLSQGRTAAAQCGLFTHKSVPVIFETPCIRRRFFSDRILTGYLFVTELSKKRESKFDELYGLGKIAVSWAI